MVDVQQNKSKTLWEVTEDDVLRYTNVSKSMARQYAFLLDPLWEAKKHPSYYDYDDEQDYFPTALFRACL